MARTAECVASEGSQDRDEWMTVIEMQEYMRASRNKAYDLIWSGEIDSYRLGRKLLVSRASVDAYIESRSASTNAIFGADEACAMLRISRDAMYRLAKDPDDPFPIRYIGGKTRDGIVLHDELVAWVERNSVVGSPRRG